MAQALNRLKKKKKRLKITYQYSLSLTLFKYYKKGIEIDANMKSCSRMRKQRKKRRLKGSYGR